MQRPRSDAVVRAQPIPLDQVRSWIGWRVDDVNGSALGRLEAVIADERGEIARWLVINEFRFGAGRRFTVPIGGAVAGPGRVWVPVDRLLVTGSAGLGGIRHTPQAERRLQSYWQLDRKIA